MTGGSALPSMSFWDRFCPSWELCHLEANLPRWTVKLPLLGSWQHCENPQISSFENVSSFPRFAH